jgi:hypothetical protein
MKSVLVSLNGHGAFMSDGHLEVVAELRWICCISAQGHSVVYQQLQIANVASFEPSAENDAGLRMPVQLTPFWFGDGIVPRSHDSRLSKKVSYSGRVGPFATVGALIEVLHNVTNIVLEGRAGISV